MLVYISCLQVLKYPFLTLSPALPSAVSVFKLRLNGRDEGLIVQVEQEGERACVCFVLIHWSVNDKKAKVMLKSWQKKQATRNRTANINTLLQQSRFIRWQTLQTCPIFKQLSLQSVKAKNFSFVRCNLQHRPQALRAVQPVSLSWSCNYCRATPSCRVQKYRLLLRRVRICWCQLLRVCRLIF